MSFRGPKLSFLHFVVNVQCSPAEFYHLASTLSRISQHFESFSEMALNDLKSELLIRIIREVSVIGAVLLTAYMLRGARLTVSQSYNRFPRC